MIHRPERSSGRIAPAWGAVLAALVGAVALTGSVRAAEPDLARVGVIPAVGNTRGANDSLFATFLNLYNASDRTANVRLVLRPLWGMGVAVPDEHEHVLPPRGRERVDLTYELGNVAGSLDVLADGPVQAEATVYSLDPMPYGNSYAIEPMVATSAGAGGPVVREGEEAPVFLRALSSSDSPVRGTIGIRSLEEGATLVFDAADGSVPQTTLSLPPESYVQEDAIELLGNPTAHGFPLHPSFLRVRVTQGSAIVLQSIVTNRGNVPQLTIAQPVPR